jgi:probable F420-dependent oxidoreductase
MNIEIGFVSDADPKRVAAMEDLPIDSLWVGGHIASPNPTPEAMMSLARLSAVTDRVKIGTSILLLPLYEPAIVAKQIADLDRDASGRLVLGVGIGGEYPAEFRACHVPMAERGRRTDEAIGLLRDLWTAETVTHHGRYYAMEDVRIHPAPAQPGGPPIVVAGRKEPAMRRAARLGDGWMPYLYSPRRYAASVEVIRALAAREGRHLQDFGWYAFVFVNVDPDGDRARDGAARAMAGNYNQDFKQMVDSVAAAGTPEEVVDKLTAFVDSGVRHFIFSPAPGPDGDGDEIVRRLLDDVIPRVRDHSTRAQVGTASS